MDTRCHQEPLEFSHFDGTSSSGRPQIALDSGERPAGLLRRRSPPLAGATQGFDTFQWENGWRMDGTWMENGWKMMEHDGQWMDNGWTMMENGWNMMENYGTLWKMMENDGK